MKRRLYPEAGRYRSEEFDLEQNADARRTRHVGPDGGLAGAMGASTGAWREGQGRGPDQERLHSHADDRKRQLAARTRIVGEPSVQSVKERQPFADHTDGSPSDARLGG
jgi:hypothetical protein